MIATQLRIDEQVYEKIKVIADQQERSINKQLNHIINQYIKDYEKINGEIKTQSR